MPEASCQTDPIIYRNVQCCTHYKKLSSGTSEKVIADWHWFGFLISRRRSETSLFKTEMECNI